MSAMTRSALGSGIFLNHVPANQFKTSVLSINLVAPLDKKYAAKNALLFQVLKRGSKSYPDLQAVSNALAKLYGGELFAIARRFGESQCFGLLTQVTSDSFTLDDSPVAVPAFQLLLDLFLNPSLEQGVFRTDYVESEKANLLEKIKGELNDKRSYANKQLLRAMCQDEPYGINPLGELDAVSAITARALYDHYLTLLKTAPIELFYCGSTPKEELETALSAALAPLSPRSPSAIAAPVIHPAPETPRFVEERLDVAQGKLGMGFRAAHDNQAAMMLMNGMFGGSVTSKLFMHVREELSLCYYASSQYDRQKQVILVSSGVEFANFEVARDAILDQLELLRNGGFDEMELEGARSALMNALRSYADSQPSLEHYWLGQAVADDSRSAAELAEQLAHVTAEQVMTAAKATTLDTIYFLNGKEA